MRNIGHRIDFCIEGKWSTFTLIKLRQSTSGSQNFEKFPHFHEDLSQRKYHKIYDKFTMPLKTEIVLLGKQYKDIIVIFKKILKILYHYW